MPQSRKRDSPEILSHLDELSRKYRSDARSWWPNFVFHYSALQNIVSILESGFLYSRENAMSRSLIGVDGASQSVLANTSDAYKDYVRLYFRPKTPTQYSNEGIRPQEKLVHGAHCPIPIMLLFDSRDILTRSETRFSEGSLAGHSPGRVGKRASFFKALPFKDIYHNSSFSTERRRTIITRRHAEVIVPSQLDLSSLRFIWCRSEAEKETLISFLRETERSRWSDKIFHGKKYDLYFSRWSYVDQVTLTQEGVEFNFNPNSCTPGPFDLRARLWDHDNGIQLKALEEGFNTSKKIFLNFDKPVKHYTIELYMSGILAYQCEYIEKDSVL